MNTINKAELFLTLEREDAWNAFDLNVEFEDDRAIITDRFAKEDEDGSIPLLADLHHGLYAIISDSLMEFDANDRIQWETVRSFFQKGA